VELVAVATPLMNKMVVRELQTQAVAVVAQAQTQLAMAVLVVRVWSLLAIHLA
jgi:hypothetical protein